MTKQDQFNEELQSGRFGYSAKFLYDYNTKTSYLKENIKDGYDRIYSRFLTLSNQLTNRVLEIIKNEPNEIGNTVKEKVKEKKKSDAKVPDFM